MPCRLPSVGLHTFGRRSALAFALAASALALPLVLAGCRGQEQRPDFPGRQALPKSSASSASARSFASPRDDLGREVKLDSPARRVLVIGPGAVETIFELGAGDRIVGRDSGADFPEAIKKVAVVADFHGPFIEACVAARPDLVLAQGETWNRERIESWQRKIGAPVAALVPTTVDAVQADADKIAGWLGVKKRALQFGNYEAPSHDATLEPSAKIQVAEGKVPLQTAFIEIQRSPLWTAGQGTLVADTVRCGGFRSVSTDVAGYKAFSKEALLKRQPDFYIATGKPGDKARILAELKSDAGLGGLRCVQRGQVLVIPGDFLLRPGPRLRDGLKLLRAAASAAEMRSAADDPAAWKRRQPAFEAAMRTPAKP